MRFGSVCSGIEAASVAWEPLGWEAAWLSEIEAFPSAVLAHHWPDVPNLGDMTSLPDRVAAGDVEAPDVLVGGTPCQAFSVAGRRESLADARGNLTLTYVELADAIDEQRNERGEQPATIVWENVPGVLNTKDNAFGCFLAGLAGEDVPLQPPGKRWTNAGLVLGPKRAVAWRILDAQYFGVAQRRRRVFVVASARDGFDPSQILFEFDGVRRDSAPRRETRQDAAADAGRGASSGAVTFDRQSSGEYGTQPVASTVSAREYKCASDLAVDTVAFHHNAQAAQLPTEGRDTSVSSSLTCSQQAAVAYRTSAVAFATQQTPKGWDLEKGTCPTLQVPSKSGGGLPHACIDSKMAVRRLTPVETERLQGFPDGHTDVPYRNKRAADGPRYKAIGNSMAVPVMAWIGRRIADYIA